MRTERRLPKYTGGDVDAGCNCLSVQEPLYLSQMGSMVQLAGLIWIPRLPQACLLLVVHWTNIFTQVTFADARVQIASCTGDLSMK